jgi:small-conductance mechanosensitive channel
LNPQSLKTAVAGWRSGVDAWSERFLSLWQEVTAPSVLLQFATIAACYLIAQGASRWLTPPLEARLRRITGQPRLLRALVVVLRRLHWILFTLFLWPIALVMAEVAWPSQSYFIRVAANLTTAWALIDISSRLIRNRSIANLVRVLAWGAAALIITGWFDTVVSMLDAAALTIGASRVSALMIIKAALLFGTLFWLASLSGELIEQRLINSLEIDASYGVLAGKLVKGALFLIAFFFCLSAIGVDLAALTVFSGAVGLGIGFGLQKVASNLISGFIILLDRSIKPGDVISVGNTFGWITTLRARYVSVNTREGMEHLIPNETFVTDRLVNLSYSDRSIRVEIKFGVSYSSDPHFVRRLAVETAKSLPRVLDVPEPVCHLAAFGESSLDFVMRFWIQDPEHGVTNLRGDCLLALWDKFKQHDIQIPYPHREVLLRRNLRSEAGDDNGGEATSGSSKRSR